MSKSLKQLFLLGAGLAFFGGNPSEAADPMEPTERLQALKSLDRPLVIAHRGYKMVAPENTLPAFELGITAQGDLIELDYYHSADGIPVVFHDTTLDRTSDATVLWNDQKIGTTSKTLAEFRELDVGSWFAPQFAGTGVLTLDEALDAIQPESITLIERKHGDPQTLVDLLTRKEMLNDVFVQAFDWEFIAGCRALVPELALGALGPPRRADGSRYPVKERFLNTAFLDQVEASGATVVGWNYQVTKEAVAEAHRRGLRVWIYTINELDTAMDLLEMGVDGLISDNPALAWKAVALHGAGWKE